MIKNRNPVFIVIDLGAESGRVIASSFGLEKLSLEVIHRFPNKPQKLESGLHWDIYGLWKEIKTGLAKASEMYGENIASIGVDTWAVDFGLFDENGSLLATPFHYRDKRTHGIMDCTFDKISKSEIFNRTGIQFLQFNSIFQLYSLVKSKSELLNSATTLMMIPDIFNFWLTGKKGIEFTNATTTQLLDYLNGDWSADILKKLEIPQNIFPNIIQTGTVLGNLLPSLAEELGVKEVPVIAVASHDTASAVAATPLNNKDEIYLSSGTWSLMGIEVDEPIVNEASLKYNFTNEGGIEGTYRFLKNISGMWLVQECKRFWETTLNANYTYSQLTELAKSAEENKVIINPSDLQFLAPANMPTTIQEYCKETNQPSPESKGEIVRCVLESLALEYRWVMERLQELSGRNFDKIHVIGGGSQNELLNQLTADFTGKIVEAGPVEATAIGNALVQAKASANINSISDGRTLVKKSFNRKTFLPKENRDEELYLRFLKLKNNNK